MASLLHASCCEGTFWSCEALEADVRRIIALRHCEIC